MCKQFTKAKMVVGRFYMGGCFNVSKENEERNWYDLLDTEN